MASSLEVSLSSPIWMRNGSFPAMAGLRVVAGIFSVWVGSNPPNALASARLWSGDLCLFAGRLVLVLTKLCSGCSTGHGMEASLGSAL